MLRHPIRPGSSDSQDPHRTIETWSAADAQPWRSMEMVLPPIVARSAARPSCALSTCTCTAMGPFAQGPVALIARHADECVFTADALGLRPLWTSRPTRTSSSAPSRRVSVARDGLRAQAARAGREGVGQNRPRAQALDSPPSRPDVGDRARALAAAQRHRGSRPLRPRPGPRRAALEGEDVPGYSDAGPEEPVKVADPILAGFWLAARRRQTGPADGVQRRRADWLARLRRPRSPRSLPSARTRRLFQGTVAVVTNPAIDREREVEHFSTRAVFGAAHRWAPPARTPRRWRPRCR